MLTWLYWFPKRRLVKRHETRRATTKRRNGTNRRLIRVLVVDVAIGVEKKRCVTRVVRFEETLRKWADLLYPIRTT